MASNDPYEVLGLGRDASEDDIRQAYRRLAKRHHPDLNPGDRVAEDAFKRVSAAYELLRDPERRARFDRGEIDAEGVEQPQRRYYRTYADAEDGAGYRSEAGYADFSDLFSDLFGGERVRLRGGDVSYEMAVDLLDAVRGAKRRVTLPDGRTLDLTIPPGTADGRVLRLRGQGLPGSGGGEPGDAYVTVRVEPHPLFARDGDDLRLEVPVSLAEAVLGGRVEVPTPTGTVALNVPKGSNTGTVLRLRSKGVPRESGGAGDLYVRLKVVLPERQDEALAEMVRAWSQEHPYDARRNWRTGRS